MNTYKRPTRTEATQKGYKARRRWSTALREAAFRLLPAVEFMAAEEGTSTALRKHPGQAKAVWATLRVRLDQMAVLDLLCCRHLKNTGKEISRSEALAALMSEGLDRLIHRDEFTA